MTVLPVLLGALPWLPVRRQAACEGGQSGKGLRAASTDGQRGPGDHQQEPGALSLTGCTGLSSADRLESLEVDLSPVEPSDEMTAPTNSCIAALGDPEAEAPS